MHTWNRLELNSGSGKNSAFGVWYYRISLFVKTNLGIVTLRFLAWDCYMPWTGLWYPFHTRSHSGWHNRSTSPNQTTPHPPDNSRLSSQMFPCSPYWKHYRAFLRTPHCWLSPESLSLYPCRRSESSQTIHSISRAIQCWRSFVQQCKCKGSDKFFVMRSMKS